MAWIHGELGQGNSGLKFDSAVSDMLYYSLAATTVSACYFILFTVFGHL